jgi:hypothetical protein
VTGDVFDFSLVKNDGFQICLQENNNLITNNVTPPSIIVNENRIVKDGVDSKVNITFVLS